MSRPTYTQKQIDNMNKKEAFKYVLCYAKYREEDAGRATPSRRMLLKPFYFRAADSHDWYDTFTISDHPIEEFNRTYICRINRYTLDKKNFPVLHVDIHKKIDRECDLNNERIEDFRLTWDYFVWSGIIDHNYSKNVKEEAAYNLYEVRRLFRTTILEWTKAEPHRFHNIAYHDKYRTEKSVIYDVDHLSDEAFGQCVFMAMLAGKISLLDIQKALETEKDIDKLYSMMVSNDYSESLEKDYPIAINKLKQLYKNYPTISIESFYEWFDNQMDNYFFNLHPDCNDLIPTILTFRFSDLKYLNE